MVYQVLLHPKANDFLSKSTSDIKNRIKKKLLKLAENPEAGNRLKFSEFWKIRIGDYMAIYEINHTTKKVIILFIGHRKEVQDDFSRLF